MNRLTKSPTWSRLLLSWTPYVMCATSEYISMKMMSFNIIGIRRRKVVSFHWLASMTNRSQLSGSGEGGTASETGSLDLMSAARRRREYVIDPPASENAARKSRHVNKGHKAPAISMRPASFHTSNLLSIVFIRLSNALKLQHHQPKIRHDRHGASL